MLINQSATVHAPFTLVRSIGKSRCAPASVPHTLLRPASNHWEYEILPTRPLPNLPVGQDKPACLRQKAEFCLWLAARISNRDLRTAVEKMRLDLLEEADALTIKRAPVRR